MLRGTLDGVSSPDDLLADAPLSAAVAALAERNRHHLDQMTDAERADALGTGTTSPWPCSPRPGRRSEVEGNGEGDAHGRAVIVLEDVILKDEGEAEVAVHASFFPQLEDVGGEVLVTPAQAAALELLEAMTGPDDDEDM